MRKILIAFIVLFLVCCNREKESQKNSPSSKPTKTAAKISNPVLTCKPEDLMIAYRKAYQLAPDRRFIIAISEIRKFFPSYKEEAVRTEFANGNWRIFYGKEEIGTIPDLADFPDLMKVLSAWTKTLNEKNPLKFATSKDGESLEAESRQFSLTPRPVKILMKADELWSKQKNGAVLAAAARETTYLSFQAYGALDLADFLGARALALITLTKVLTAYPMDREESLLAYALYYSRHADNMASLLPPQDPIRMFLTKTDLSEMASSKSASEEVRFFRLMQLSNQFYTKLWREGQAKLFPNDLSIAVLTSGLSIRRLRQAENESLDYLADEIPHTVISELQSLKTGSPPKRMADEEDPKLLSSFETLIDELYKTRSGIFSDAEVLASLYNSLFYNSYSHRNLSPGKGKRDVSVEFDRYIALFQLAKQSNQKVENFIEQTRSIKHLGGLGGFALKALINQLPWDSPSIPLLCREVASTFDARPSHRIWMAWIYRWKLYDRNHAEELYSSLLNTISPNDADRIVEAAVYLGEVNLLKDILHAPQCEEMCASNVLYNWAYTDEFHNNEIEEEYDRHVKKNPHSWQITNVYVEFLRKIKKYPKANKVVSDWLRNNPDPNHVGFFHANTRLAHGYYLAGEYEKSLQALKSITPSWVADRESALALSKLGKKEEAERLGKAAARAASEDFESLLVLVQVLWEGGKYKEAASTLQASNYPSQNWCSDVSTSFFRAFQNSSSTEVHKAIDALRAAHLTGWRLTCLPMGFAEARQYGMAFEIQSYIMPAGSADMDVAIESYRYLKEWKGEKEAIQWIRKMIPPNKMNPLSIKALYTGEYNLLWDVIQVPDPKQRPDWVWLFRAAAFVKAGTNQDPHSAELLKYFSQGTKNPYHTMGRYLLGLSTEQELLKIAENPSYRCQVSYYIGVKSEGEGRLRDATDWYRIAVETGLRNSEGWHLSLQSLSNGPVLGYWTIKKDQKNPSIAKKS